MAAKNRGRDLMRHIVALLLLLAAMPARAQPISIVVPFPPGGLADVMARLVGEQLRERLGQPVVIDNRPGAGGIVGARLVAGAAPDGTTLLLDASGHTVAPFLIRGLNFDYASGFTPISHVMLIPQMLIVPPNSPYTSLPQLLAAAKAAPGRITYGSSGNASAPHIAAAVLVNRAGVEMTHVPYRGGGPALQSLLAGDLDFVFATVASATALARDGRVRALAASSARRITALPEVPTVAEQGFPGYDQNEWNGLWGPAGLPAEAVQRLHAACLHALADEAVKARLAALGAIGLGTTPAEFTAFLARDREANAKLIRDARITLD